MKEIFKGILIGIGKIIPGVSGSVIAISLGVYERAISCITNFFSDIRNNIRYLGLLGLGVIISITLTSKGISYLLDHYYVYTILLFVGLIFGSTKSFNSSDKQYNWISLLSFSFVIMFGFLSGENQIKFDNYLLEFLFLIFIGLIEAATMIIPGISGTAVLMMLGVYNLIINTYSDLFSIDKIGVNFSIMLPFFIGIIVGTFLIARIINYLFNNYSKQTNKAIFGFLMGTIVYMIISVLKVLNNPLQLILGLLFMFIGLISMKKINHLL